MTCFTSFGSLIPLIRVGREGVKKNILLFSFIISSSYKYLDPGMPFKNVFSNFIGRTWRAGNGIFSWTGAKKLLTLQGVIGYYSKRFCASDDLCLLMLRDYFFGGIDAYD